MCVGPGQADSEVVVAAREGGEVAGAVAEVEVEGLGDGWVLHLIENIECYQVVSSKYDSVARSQEIKGKDKGKGIQGEGEAG